MARSGAAQEDRPEDMTNGPDRYGKHRTDRPTPGTMLFTWRAFQRGHVRSTLECVWQQPPPSARDSYGARTNERRWLLPHALQGTSYVI